MHAVIAVTGQGAGLHVWSENMLLIYHQLGLDGKAGLISVSLWISVTEQTGELSVSAEPTATPSW